MCLAIAGVVREIDGDEGLVAYDGVSRRVELTLVPEARVGDAVLVHAGFAIAILTPEEGREQMALLRETAFHV